MANNFVILHVGSITIPPMPDGGLGSFRSVMTNWGPFRMWCHFGKKFAMLATFAAVLAFTAASPVAAPQANAAPASAATGADASMISSISHATRHPQEPVRHSASIAQQTGKPRAAVGVGPTTAGRMHPADNPGGQEQCFFVYPTCGSFSPAVSLVLVSDGDTSGCSFDVDLDWGDGSSTEQTLAGGPDGSPLGTLDHTYADDPGSYPVSWTSTVSAGNCEDSSGSLTFTLLSPLGSAEQGGAENPSEKPVNCSTTEPVNCATGVFWHTFTDFSVPGRGVPLELTRTYTSAAASTNGPFGYGWTDSYDMFLATASSGDVTITQEDGATVTFTPDGSGGFTAPPQVEATLVSDSSGGYTFSRDDGGTSYRFSAAGKLTSEADLNGYVTTLAYNAKGQLATVTDPARRQLTFTYSGTHIATATDPMGRAWKYGYNASGNLAQATDPLGRTWSFTYDAQHRLLTTADPRGGKTSSTYNASSQVTAQVDPDGGKTTWSYSGNPATLAGGSTTMTDPDGNVTQYKFSDLEMVSVTAGAGTASAATTTYTYDPMTLGIVSEQNPDGDTTTNTYDANGNLLTTTDALGNTTTYTYNSLNKALTKTDPIGGTTYHSYDANGNLLSVTDPLGDTTTYGYQDTAHPGDITSVTDPDGNVTSYVYDSDGDVASVSVSPSTGVTDTTDYTHDKDGERTCAASPDAVAAGIKCPAAGTTTTTYDADGEVTSVTDPNRYVTRYTYDADGDQASVTNPAGQVTGYAYNGDGEQVQVTHPGSKAQVTAYNGDDNVTSQANAAGGITRYAYDALGLVVSATDPLGHVTTYGYDPAGNRVTLTDAEGQVTSYAYDKDGRLTGITYSGGKTPAVSYAYDADGRRASMTDGTGTTTYGYDADSHLTGVTDGGDATVSYGYDDAGLLASITYPNGQAVTRGYDRAGELTSVSDWLGNTTTFVYDHDGNVTSESYPNGVSALPAYDKADQLTSVTDKKGSSTLASFSYARNSLGEVAADTEAGAVAGAQHYSYTQLSELASDSAGSYGYDPAGDLTAQPGGETQAFNAAGELTSTTVRTATTSYSYDKDGDLTSAGSVSLAYNQAGELTGYGTAATYAYDGDGLRSSKTVGGTTTAFAWDQSGSTPLLIAAGSTYYVYGPDGQPIEQVTGTTPSYLLADQSGSTRLITSATGAVTGTYTYGPYGTVTRDTGTATTALQYDGQYTDTESGYQYLQARYYDPATGQFLTADPDVTVTLAPYGYAADNPLNVNDPSGQCPMCVSMVIGGTIGGIAGAIGGCTGTATGAGCFSAITGGVFAGVCAGSGVGIIEAGACGAGGNSLSSMFQTGLGERQCLGNVLAGDAFGFLGGAAGAAAFPINKGWFAPTNLSSIWNPGTYAGLVYKSSLLSGLIGEIPDVYNNFSSFFNWVGQQYSNEFNSLFQGDPYAPQPFNPSSAPPPDPPF
jgi:RHS repeat-associated protein